MPRPAFMWMDYFILTIIGVSVLLGTGRGFVKEAISLCAWISAFILTFAFGDEMSVYLTSHIDTASLRIVLAFGIVFSLTLSLGGLVNLIVAQALVRARVRPTDRVVGALLGLLRGMAASVLVVLLTGLTPIPEDPRWSRSPLLAHLQEAALWLRGFLPPALAVHVTFP